MPETKTKQKQTKNTFFFNFKTPQLNMVEGVLMAIAVRSLNTYLPLYWMVLNGLYLDRVELKSTGGVAAALQSTPTGEPWPVNLNSNIVVYY